MLCHLGVHVEPEHLKPNYLSWEEDSTTNHLLSKCLSIALAQPFFFVAILPDKLYKLFVYFEQATTKNKENYGVMNYGNHAVPSAYRNQTLP